MIIIFQDVRAPEVITIPLTTAMEHLLTQYGKLLEILVLQNLAKLGECEQLNVKNRKAGVK